MRKRFKTIISAVLSAAMVLSLGTGTNLRIASADGEATGTTEKAGFTARIGFQTNDYDFRNALTDYEYGDGQKYLSELAEKDESFDLEAHNENQKGYNIYYKGRAPKISTTTLELQNFNDVMLNSDAVAEDVEITEDGEYTVSITGLDLTKQFPDEDVMVADPEYFNMLYIATDISVTAGVAEGVEVKASSIIIDNEELLDGEVVLPQKQEAKPKDTYMQLMIADIYNNAKYAENKVDLLYGDGKSGNPATLTKIPEDSITITFSISGLDKAVKYEPKLERVPPTAETEGPITTVPPIDKAKISKPFNIGVAANVNDALAPKVSGDPIAASVFGTKEFWELGKASLDYNEEEYHFIEGADSSLSITETGAYELSITALGDSEDLKSTGAVWFPMIPNEMPKDYNLVGYTITVGGKTYPWGAKLAQDSEGSVRLPVCNTYIPDDEVMNPIKNIIPVKKGDKITFSFAVTGDAPDAPAATTPPPTAAKKSYNAYLGFETNNWAFRNIWNHKTLGLNSKDLKYKTQIGMSFDGIKAYDATIKDAEIKEGVTKYTVSISGVNLKTLKGEDLATQFNMIFLSTDIPRSMTGVKFTDATLKLDGKVIKTYKTLPAKHDTKDYYQMMLANAYGSKTSPVTYEFSKENPLKTLPTKSIEVSFSVSGVNFDKSTVGPAKDKTFENGNFKYKVTKESQYSASKKKTTPGKVTVVGLSKKGKKAKKNLVIPATLKQKKGEFKVTNIKAGALKKAKASSVTIKSADIKKLPANVFKDCKNLKKLKLSAKLSSVHKKAFDGCTKKIAISGKAKKQNVKKIKKAYSKVK